MATVSGLAPEVFYAAYTVTVVISRVAFASLGTARSPFSLQLAFLIVMVAGAGLFASGQGVTSHVLATMLFAFGYGMTYPTIKAICSLSVPDAHRDDALFLFGLSYFLGIFGGPFLMGRYVQQEGPRSVLLVLVALAFLEAMCGVWLLLVGTQSNDSGKS